MNSDDPDLSRRALLVGAAASLAAPSTAFAGAPKASCQPPRYLPWIAKRERRWRDELGEGGFVNYYGEPFPFDERIIVPTETFPTCDVQGAVRSTLARKGRLRDNVAALEIDGKPSSTNCFVWPEPAADGFERSVAGLYKEMKGRAPDPAKAKLRFTAVGSRHSSSDVYRRLPDGRAAVLHIEGLNHVLPHRPEWRSAFIEAHPERSFALVGAGITVCQLNEALWNQGLAIETQGSFDGQTLAGAISTGTHGAGCAVGSVGDSVESVILITATRDSDGRPRWEVLQIEPNPHEAITDPVEFRTERAGVPWRLIQDRALFEAAVMTMGTMGVVVGYVMRVRPAYFLYEIRVGRPWTEVRENLVDRAVGPPSGFSPRGWRYELVVSPSRIRGAEDWACTEVYRDEWAYDLDYLSATREIPQQWLGGVTRNLNMGGAIGNTVADLSSRGLVRGRRLGSFADRCYRVLKLGQGEFVQAWGTELLVPAERGAELVDWVLKRNPERGELKRGRRRGTRLLNPFGVRFCTGQNGFLTPVRWKRDGAPALVCTAELTEAVKNNDRLNRDGTDHKPSSKAIVESWAEDFIQTFGTDGRVHWGQAQGAYGPEQLASSYSAEDIDGWYDGFRTLNPYGLFDTAFVERLGFVRRRAEDGDRAPARYRGLGRPLQESGSHSPHAAHPTIPPDAVDSD